MPHGIFKKKTCHRVEFKDHGPYHGHFDSRGVAGWQEVRDVLRCGTMEMGLSESEQRPV